MLTTIAILFLIASVLTCLFLGLFYLFRKREKDSIKTVRALTFRVIFSIAVFLAVMISFLGQWGLNA